MDKEENQEEYNKKELKEEEFTEEIQKGKEQIEE